MCFLYIMNVDELRCRLAKGMMRTDDRRYDAQEFFFFYSLQEAAIMTLFSVDDVADVFGTLE